MFREFIGNAFAISFPAQRVGKFIRTFRPFHFERNDVGSIGRFQSPDNKKPPATGQVFPREYRRLRISIPLLRVRLPPGPLIKLPFARVRGGFIVVLTIGAGLSNPHAVIGPPLPFDKYSLAASANVHRRCHLRTGKTCLPLSQSPPAWPLRLSLEIV